MRLLLLGGTRFVGRHVVELALAGGHEVSLFTRGKTNADLFPQVEHLHGDRETGDYEALKGKTWDAVIDTCGYVPRAVRQAGEVLKDAVDRYLFISTISVYDDGMPAGADETAPLKKLTDEATEEVTGETYGGLKVLCELAAQSIFAERAIIVRPGMIVGQYDPTDRFTYWVKRISQGGEVLVPGHAQRPVQMIDGKDLGAFQLKLLQDGTLGVYNATGATQPFAWGDWVGGMRDALGSDATFTWVDDAWLEEQQVNGMQLPFWVPEQYAGVFAVSVQRAVAAGLTFRPFADTVRDTLAFEQTLPADQPRRAGLDPAREAELLKLWKEKQSSQ